MSVPVTNRIRLGGLCVFAALGFEGAAVIAYLAPVYFEIPGDQALFLHFVGSWVGALGAAAMVSAGHSRRDWVGVSIFFALLALLIPAAGLLAVLFLAAVLHGHNRSAEPEKRTLRVVPKRHECEERVPSIHAAGPVKQPLAGQLGFLAPDELQKITLGMDVVPPRRTRPILKRLQCHPDVRVQLYANGLLNDQLDGLERRLASLKQCVKDDPNDEFSQTSIVETYSYLFDHRLVPNDEAEQTARLALVEADTVLKLNPANGVVLAAKICFLVVLREFRHAAVMLNRLQLIPGHEAVANELYARIAFEFQATQPVPPAAGPVPGIEEQSPQQTRRSNLS